MAQYLQSTWQENLGITVTMNPIEDSTYSDWRAARETEKFGVYTGSWGSDFADASNWFNQNFTHCRRSLSQPLEQSRFRCAGGHGGDEHQSRGAQPAVQPGRSDPGQRGADHPVLHGKAFRFVKPWVKDLYFQPIGSIVHLRDDQDRRALDRFRTGADRHAIGVRLHCLSFHEPDGYAMSRSAYIIRRVLLLIPTLLAIYTLTFLLIHATPGGPWSARAKNLSRRSC